MNKLIPSLERIKDAVDYEPETGVVTWKRPRGRVLPGTTAGTPDGGGYLMIRIDKVGIRLHKLAWYYTYGEYPHFQIDHKDGDRTNNAIGNLRRASQSENNQNQRVGRGTNRNGYLGVYRRKDTGLYSAQIKLDGCNHRLGCFPTAEDARDAYLSAKKRLHPFQTIA